MHIDASIVLELRFQLGRLRSNILKISSDRYPQMVLDGRVHGQRKRGQEKKWMHVIKEDCRKWWHMTLSRLLKYFDGGIPLESCCWAPGGHWDEYVKENSWIFLAGHYILAYRAYVKRMTSVCLSISNVGRLWSYSATKSGNDHITG